MVLVTTKNTTNARNEQSYAHTIGLLSFLQASLRQTWTHQEVKRSYNQCGEQVNPTPFQQPRIPIWIAGVWPFKKPFQRAARWDGVCPLKHSYQLMQPDDIREMLASIRQFRMNNESFDVLASGNTSGTEHQKDLDLIMSYAKAGATWWQESFAGSDSEELEAVRIRIRRGPPGSKWGRGRVPSLIMLYCLISRDFDRKAR
jgi:hypothetical protein